MKALLYTDPLTLTYTDVPTPSPEAGDLLLKVSTAGICGSDMHAFQGQDERRKPPLILGHEVCGLAQNTALAGKRVVINPLMTCGHCPACRCDRSHLCASREIIGMRRAGAFAEYLTIPADNALVVPDHLFDSQAAMTEPAATAYHAVKMASRLSHTPFAEQKILIIGGGAIGILAVFLLHSYGAHAISLVQRNALKRSALQAFMPCPVISDDDAAQLPAAQFDLIIDAVGSKASRTLGSSCVAPGGVFIHVGLSDAHEGLDIRKFTLQEILFSGVYCYSFLDFQQSLNAIARGAFGDLKWAHTYPLAKGAEAFQALYDRTTPAAKILLACT
jgi:threonine dehydrogenase-like Zn-dependent dehydrogenase